MQHLRNATARADRRRVGSISVGDLDIICRAYGRDFLPYPFMHTVPSQLSDGDEYLAYAASVPDRFNHGDLGVFRRWAESYVRGEIRVECHVQYIPADTPSMRVVAHRVGELGYLATQRPDEDVIDVYEVSPYELGRAVVDSVELIKPGAEPVIIVPEYARSNQNGQTSDDFTVLDYVNAPMALEVSRGDVTAIGKVQSHWRPTRRWGFDRRKAGVVWARVRDDGEYVFSKDFRDATPLNRPSLIEKIDTLIAEDVKVLREFRS